MAISYSKTTWTDNVTDVNATNLNHIEAGIKSACDGVDSVNDNVMPKVMGYQLGGGMVATITFSKMCELKIFRGGAYANYLFDSWDAKATVTNTLATVTATVSSKVITITNSGTGAVLIIAHIFDAVTTL